MLFEIDHLTRYRYSVPVALGEHRLRFLPSRRAGQEPGDCRVLIEPEPRRHEYALDAWGNRIEKVWFEGETSELSFRALLTVETFEGAFPLPPVALPLPVDYGAQGVELAPFLEPLERPERLITFVQPLLDAAGGDALAFLAGLNHRVHAFYQPCIRLEGAPRSPAETLDRGEGVCRDLSVLFMAACRQAGLAARFVSGFQQGDGTREQRYLHAWAEVWLPDSGWVGYDPTHDTLVGHDHVAVAAAPTTVAVTPVEGVYSFNGKVLTSTLETEIFITTVDSPQ